MVYLMIAFGAILVFFLIASSISQSQKEKETSKRNENETKLKLQTFILTARSLFPDSEIKLLHDRTALLESPLLNPNNKKVGTIEISGDRSLKYTSNEPYYLLYVRVRIDDTLFEQRENFVEDESNVIFEKLNIMINLILSNQELRKRILATTY